MANTNHKKESKFNGFGMVIDQLKSSFASYYRNPVATGVTAAIILYCVVAGTVSLVVPVGNNSGDTRSHVDYVWRLYNNDIPRINDGIQYKAFVTEGNRDMQPQANHPPLFYALQVPVVGPLLASGNWQAAVMVGRAINIIIGTLCVLALAYAAWLYGGKYRSMLAVAVPVIATLSYRFTTLNINYASDALLVLLATLIFIVLHKLIEAGITKWQVVILAVLCVAGMLTKATFIVMVATTCVGLAASVLLRKPSLRKKEFIRAAIAGLFIIVTVILSTGWFYQRNYEASGSWYKSTKDSYTGGRDYKTLNQVLTSGKLRGIFYEEYTSNIPLSIAITSFAAVGVTGVTSFKGSKLINTKRKLLYGLTMLACVVGMLVIQIGFAVGYGSINFRYIMPALFPLALFLGYGLVQFRWSKGQIITAVAGLMALSTLLPLASSSLIIRLIPETALASNGVSRIFVAMRENGLPVVAPLLLIILLILGMWLLGRSLYQLSQKVD